MILIEQDTSPGGAGTALTWQELRLAAEAGFDELLRKQEEDRVMGADAGVGMPDQLYTGAAGGRNRSPYRSPLAMQRALAAAGKGRMAHVFILYTMKDVTFY